MELSSRLNKTKSNGSWGGVREQRKCESRVLTNGDISELEV
jgi:hypothetical protein